ncbi:MAG: OmpH family outer membrane protein [Myxococcaceae bacterium]
MATVLVVDLTALLDTSKVGAEATKGLEKTWKESEKQPEAERTKLLAKLQKQRDGLREALFARARPLLAEIAKEKKADLVLERSAVLWGSSEDVTKALIKKVDAGGPLKL